MNGYKTHNEIEINVNMSHGQGGVESSYTDLLLAFGLPGEADGYKIDAEWELLFDDGTIATLYNWKNGKNYNDNGEGDETEDITDWNIGGFDKESVDRILSVLADKRYLGYITVNEIEELTNLKEHLKKLGFVITIPEDRDDAPIDLVIAYYPTFKNKTCAIMYHSIDTKEILYKDVFTTDFESLLFDAIL